MADEERNEVNRREFLRKAAITGAVAWAIPVVQSVAATPAYAQTLSPGCPHSTPDTLGGSCMGTCKATCVIQIGVECGSGCNDDCNANCQPNIGCFPQACRQACWTCTGTSGGDCEATLNLNC
jgi:hypothetical protein